MNFSSLSTKKFIHLVFVGLLILIFVLLFRACCVWSDAPMDYETRDISDYGVFIGNSEEYMRAYINRFFPDTIPNNAQNVTYVFRSRSVDERAFEVYLEYVIEDEISFADHVNTVTNGLFERPFNYDRSYQEYIVYEQDAGYLHDEILLNRTYYMEGNPKPFYKIGSASIAKILVNYSEHRIIYVALSVFDGGAADTDFFSEYFNRFNLDPYQYAINSRNTCYQSSEQ